MTRDRMVKLKLIIVLFLLSTIFYALGANVTTPPPCGLFSWNIPNEIPLGTANDLPQFTVFGDSRAKFVSEHGRLGNFADATKDGKKIIAGNQIKKIQNLGWAGATASDNQRDLFEWISGYLSQTPGKYKEMTWWRQWDRCKQSGVSYVTHPKTVMNLGGNDMVNFEKYYATRDGLLGPLTVILNPEALLGIFGKPASPFEKEMRWNWAFNSKEEIILRNMKNTASRILNQSAHHQLLLVDIAPRGPTIFGNDPLIDLGRIARLNVYISRLNRKYYDRLVPELQSYHGKYRVHFLDVFNRFYANLIGEWATFYYGGSQPSSPLPLDGVHYGNEGNREFALMITAKMLRIGWFQRDPNITDEMLDAISAGIPIDLSGVCDLKCWATICYLTKICKFTDFLKIYFQDQLDQQFWDDQEANPPPDNPTP